MRHGVKRTLGLVMALVVLSSLIPIGAAFAACNCCNSCTCSSPCNCAYCGYPYYPQGGEWRGQSSPWGGYAYFQPYWYPENYKPAQRRGVSDTVIGMRTASFKGDGAYVYDNASTDRPLKWISSGTTIYLDEANQYQGWVMVYYRGGDAKGWAQWSKIKGY